MEEATSWKGAPKPPGGEKKGKKIGSGEGGVLGETLLCKERGVQCLRSSRPGGSGWDFNFGHKNS